MSNQKANSVDRFARWDFTGKIFRAGMAKDQLIFVIICSAALLVAAVTMVHFFTGSSKKGNIATSWQCLKCDHEFSKKTDEFPPIECPKCGGGAVRVVYRKCLSCGADVPCYRMRLAGQEQAGSQPVALGMVNMETQHWIKQADGSYTWTDWINPIGSPQRDMQIKKNMRCSECDALLFAPSPRSGGSGN